MTAKTSVVREREREHSDSDQDSTVQYSIKEVLVSIEFKYFLLPIIIVNISISELRMSVRANRVVIL